MAIAIFVSARKLCAALASVSNDITTAIRATGGSDRIVVVNGSAGGTTPTFDDTSEEMLALHQRRYESKDWRVAAATEDVVDDQDDVSDMTESLRRLRRNPNG